LGPDHFNKQSSPEGLLFQTSQLLPNPVKIKIKLYTLFVFWWLLFGFGNRSPQVPLLREFSWLFNASLHAPLKESLLPGSVTLSCSQAQAPHCS
jgi:hypothetical protein